MYRLFIFMLLSFVFVEIQAQKTYSTQKKKAINLFEQAQNNYNIGQLVDAVKDLDNALKVDENFIEAYILKAQIYYEVGQIEKEVEQYEKAIEINRSYSPKIHYLLSIAYFNTEQYRKSLEISIEAKTMDIKSERLVRMIDESIKAAKVATELYENPVPFNPVNLGDKVNSPYDDYWPMLTADGKKLYTTKNIPIRNDMPYGPNNAQEDFFVNYKQDDGSWGQVFSVGPPLNTPYNEGAPSISADGQTFVFTACNRRDGYGKCDIYISKFSDGHWTVLKNIGEPINSEYLERQPSISADGTTLYFASDRPGTDGLEDIWVSHLENDKWSKPVNLGDSINTNGIEWSPFIHPDGRTLYFVSNGHYGLGGLDIYKSTRINDTTWTQAKNLGYPINTVFDEQSLFVSIAGDLALISSGRANDGNGLDIYGFDLYEEAQPNYVSYMAGNIKDADSKEAITATIELIDLKTGELIMQPISDSKDGSFLLCLPSNQPFMLNISKEGYMPYSEHFELEADQKQGPVQNQIHLQSIKVGAQTILKNIFFELDSYDLKPESELELQKLLSFMKTNSHVSIEIGGHTDNQGSATYNQNLSEQRAKTVYQYLIDKGIAAQRMKYKGYGLNQPIDTNDTHEGRANNRRTEFKIIGM
ncbi:MAG: PD40 domain-containing protein [Bacteroidales bacterium]|nr:PD40 domain-containing protein [Bacteroidales bacterium]